MFITKKILLSILVFLAIGILSVNHLNTSRLQFQYDQDLSKNIIARVTRMQYCQNTYNNNSCVGTVDYSIEMDSWQNLYLFNGRESYIYVINVNGDLLKEIDISKYLDELPQSHRGAGLFFDEDAGQIYVYLKAMQADETSTLVIAYDISKQKLRKLSLNEENTFKEVYIHGIHSYIATPHHYSVLDSNGEIVLISSETKTKKTNRWIGNNELFSYYLTPNSDTINGQYILKVNSDLTVVDKIQLINVPRHESDKIIIDKKGDVLIEVTDTAQDIWYIKLYSFDHAQ